jgi:hypothetical protein
VGRCLEVGILGGQAFGAGRHYQVVVSCHEGEVGEACCGENPVRDQGSSQLYSVVATQLVALGQADRLINDGATDG